MKRQQCIGFIGGAAAATAIWGLCVFEAVASDVAENMGVGLVSCAEFAKQYRANTDTEYVFFHWAQGFMSGINDALASTGHEIRVLNSISTDRQKQILRAFCASNPLLPYRDGINAVLNEMTLARPKPAK